MDVHPLLSEEQRLVQDSARRFAERLGGPARLRRIGEAAEGYDGEAMHAAASAGWTGLLAPEKAGGAGLGVGALCLIAEELGRRLCVLPLGAASAAALALAAAPRAPLLAASLRGEALAMPAMLAGAERVSLARASSGEWRVSGRWDGIPAARCAAFVVEAAGEAAHLLFTVASDANGAELVPGRAIDGSAVCALELRELRVPADAVIASGEAARALAARMRAAIQLAVAAEMLGIMDASMSRTLEYLGTRVQFGQPIGKFQALRHQAVDNYVQKEMTRALVFEAARAADAAGGGPAGEEPHADYERLAVGARVLAGESSLALAKSAIQMHGAIGFTDEHDIGLFLKRAMALAAHYGPTGTQRQRYRAGLRRGADGEWQGIARFGSENEADRRFRAEVRQWLEESLPHELRNLPTRPPFRPAMAWHRRLFERGWIAPGWPKEWGGMGASLTRQVILADELARVGAPEISGQGLNHIGPILIRFGTAEQKKRHLPPILSGETVWCQGYSEPNAGSDLASLTTRATVEGDRLVVNGQKIWTTWAHNADWMFALVRTNPRAAKKHEGISFVLIDMKSPGITRRPIRTIAGDDELAQVFLDDVRVPMENLVGELNGGWKIANALLVHERLGSASTQKDIVMLHHVWRLAAASGLWKDEAFLDRLAGAEIELTALSAAHAQAIALLEGGHVGAESSFMKIAGTALLQRLSDLLFEAACALRGGQSPVRLGELSIDAASSFLQNRRATIYGGTQEIQKDIVAKRVLGLP